MTMNFKNIKILIDNGHGFDTLGKESPDKMLREYAWTRDIAKRLEARLKALGFDAQRITPEENDISITTRVNRINAICRTVGVKNVLLVSIHNNAAGNGGWGTAKGFSVFVSKNSSANSKKCASIFTDEAIARKMMGNRSIPDCKYWTWGWTTKDISILKNSNCPAVLTENGFMDNKEECAWLLSEQGKEQVVDLHVAAITKYVESFNS